MSKPIIKYIKFKKKDAQVGGCNFLTGVIEIDERLPKKSQGTRRLCEEHELAHWRNRGVDIKGLLGSRIAEEAFIELEAVVHTPYINLSHTESLTKRYLLLGSNHKFDNVRDKFRIVQRMLDFLGVELTKEKLVIFLSQVK